MAEPTDSTSTTTDAALEFSEEEAPPDGIVILPTGQGGRYADIALTGLFGAHLANLNVGKQLIWQRYYVLLAANAALLALTSHPASLYEAVGYLCFGLTLCAIWFLLSVVGWSHNIRDVQVASRFIWCIFEKKSRKYIELNPCAIARSGYMAAWHEGGWIRDGIFLLSLCLVLATGIAHVALFLRILIGQ